MKAFLSARARWNMALRDVDAVDTEAIEAIIQEPTSNDTQKAAAIKQLLIQE